MGNGADQEEATDYNGPVTSYWRLMATNYWRPMATTIGDYWQQTGDRLATDYRRRLATDGDQLLTTDWRPINY